MKRPEFRVRLASYDKNAPTEERQPLISPTDLDHAVALVKKAALFAGGVYLAGKVVDAACTIAVHKATQE